MKGKYTYFISIICLLFGLPTFGANSDIRDLTSPITSPPQDNNSNPCARLLDHGVFDKKYVYGTWFEVRHIITQLCEQDFKNSSDASSSSLNIGIPIEDAFASVGLSTNSKDFDTSYHTMCSHIDDYAAAGAKHIFVYTKADEVLVNAFLQCIRSTRLLSAWAEPVDEKHFDVYAHFFGTPTEPVARHAKLEVNNSGTECDAVNNNGVIAASDSITHCSRQDETQASSVILTTDGGDAQFTVPAIPRFLCETYQASHKDSVTCNDNTAKGYDWKVGGKIEHYSTAGEGHGEGAVEPYCNEKNLGQSANTFRFPYLQDTYQPVWKFWVARAPGSFTAPGCNYIGLGVKLGDQDRGAQCGIFEAICEKQPSMP
jgi:hypothetical protein